MILPTKHVKISQSIVGLGAEVLRVLGDEQTLTRLWEGLRSTADKVTFERFILALDFLFLLGCIEMTDGVLRRRSIE
jgi:hypothetical protein